ncbi:uncharacterized protein EMH_0053010 [Eimeria mitis]|uniref:Uncharacterized protein n=1 Tax=Eimeria mitis TaxID=44415 RepID=U6KHG4_9EIME|nr:uncharacterized protein EMH_0053010 [Eimeria mitis]CDJ36236.1 hypothetical protein, conserved [Eimeria mitis]
MASMRSSGRSRSTLFEDEACISRDGDRTRSQLLEKSGLHKTSKASKNLASTKHDSSSRSKAESDNQETTKSVRSTPDQCALVSSLRKSKTVHIPRIWDELPAWRLEYEALTGIQQQVMEYVASNSEAESAAAKARLQKSWAVFNISDQDFSKIELYLAKKVPLTIRVDIQGLFPYLIHDPFYRTCFETNIKGSVYLEARREFEAVLFNNLYEHPSVQPQDRPKYGVLNMVCHPFSDSRVSSFGSAYLLLKDSLRTRRVGTLDHMWHIVETLSNHEITRIHAVATGIRAKATVSPDSKYSEIQIHGMIDVRKDVAAIVVQRKDLESNRTGPLIQELSKRYILPVLTCEELDENLGDRRWSTVINQRANYLLQKTMAMHDATYSTCKWSV